MPMLTVAVLVVMMTVGWLDFVRETVSVPASESLDVILDDQVLVNVDDSTEKGAEDFSGGGIYFVDEEITKETLPDVRVDLMTLVEPGVSVNFELA